MPLADTRTPQPEDGRRELLAFVGLSFICSAASCAVITVVHFLT